MNDTEALIERLRSTDEERLNMEPWSCERDMKAAADALDELRERESAVREFIKVHPAFSLIDMAEFEAFLKMPAAIRALEHKP